MVNDNVSFYPVIQLLTGPPGLTRNGGVWKIIKRDLAKILNPANIMIQALHMKNYELSRNSWAIWNENIDGKSILANEIEKTFGSSRNIFVDSGGFQLMYKDKIDLSKWGLDLSPQSILELQCKFLPDKVASLDYPLSLKASKCEVGICAKQSITNIEYLLDNYETYDRAPMPYLAVHGRTPSEIAAYLHRLDSILKCRKPESFGIALGSQVPLARTPNNIISNVSTVLKWMDKRFNNDVALHLFGIGEPVVGAINKTNTSMRNISFDNSTSVQRGYMQKMYDPHIKKYVLFSTQLLINCDCPACMELKKLGIDGVMEVLSNKSYSKENKYAFTRSDVFALITLHNIWYWKDRVNNMKMSSTINMNMKICKEKSVSMNYEFPLRAFKNNSPNLILMACSKTRPYRDSPSHKKVIRTLKYCGYEELRDYDRITLSGLFGPVYWEDEDDMRIINYDFQLCKGVSESHKQNLRVRTATVLNSISKKYNRIIAYLPAKQYRETFKPTLDNFETIFVQSCNEIPDALEN